MGGDADEDVAAENPARGIEREVVLPEVDALGRRLLELEEPDEIWSRIAEAIDRIAA